MNPNGINIDFLLLQMITIVFWLFLIGWPLLSVIALFSLRNRQMKGLVLVLWVILVVLVPIMGAIALWIVNPRKQGD